MKRVIADKPMKAALQARFLLVQVRSISSANSGVQSFVGLKLSLTFSSFLGSLVSTMWECCRGKSVEREEGKIQKLKNRLYFTFSGNIVNPEWQLSYCKAQFRQHAELIEVVRGGEKGGRGGGKGEESFDPKSQYLVTKKQKENKAFHLYHEYNTINISN